MISSIGGPLTNRSTTWRQMKELEIKQEIYEWNRNKNQFKANKEFFIISGILTLLFFFSSPYSIINLLKFFLFYFISFFFTFTEFFFGGGLDGGELPLLKFFSASSSQLYNFVRFLSFLYYIHILSLIFIMFITFFAKTLFISVLHSCFLQSSIFFIIPIYELSVRQ